MIVAPLLALLAYFAVDLMVKEKPRIAVAGQAYPMVAKSNCRFTSGECNLENASFISQLSVDADSNMLKLTSSHALQNATIGFVYKDGAEVLPAGMHALDDTNRLWQLAMPINARDDTIARIALQANNAFYFAETGMQFVTYKTTYDKNFRANN